MKYVLTVNGKEEVCSLARAGALYDNGWAQVEIVGVVQDCGCRRPATDQEKRAVSDTADEYSASK